MSLHPPADKRVSPPDAAALVGDGVMVAPAAACPVGCPWPWSELVRQRRTGSAPGRPAHSIDGTCWWGRGGRRCEKAGVGFEQDGAGSSLPPRRRGGHDRGGGEPPRHDPGPARRRDAGARPSPRVRVGHRSPHPEHAEITCPFTGETLVAVPPPPRTWPRCTRCPGTVTATRTSEQLRPDERLASASRMVVATVDELVSTRAGLRRASPSPGTWSRPWPMSRSGRTRRPVIPATPTTAPICAST
jgi:glutaconate CoA-transferase subunit A